MPPRFKPTILALVSAGLLGLASGAHALTMVSGTPTDSPTNLSIKWEWDAAGGASGLFSGLYWLAEATATFGGGSWTVDTSYKHLSSPHGEGSEFLSPSHDHQVIGTGPSILTASGTDDHVGAVFTTSHHTWSLTGASDIGGGLTLQVAHVPEPGSWALMLAGTAGLLGFRMRRNRKPV